MNQALTEIVFILDRSGSMQAMVELAISGFNRLLREQQQISGNARFTLVLFDDQYEVPFHSVPIAEVVELDTSTFVPRGNTALVDAIGRTVDELSKKLAAAPAADRPNQVIIAVLTDGEENSSHRYSWNDVAKRIRHQTEQHRWQFLFLGANQDAIATAGKMNIEAANSANFTMSERSYDSSKGALSRKMSAFRRQAQGATDAETLHDAAAPLESLREEEERKHEP
ncbi:VWA domain-containing protein [bacterium]|nr:VWA domain-containing protein [bacterium]